MIDHLGFGVGDYARAKTFYTAALAPLSYAVVMEVTAEQAESGRSAAGFGANGKPDFSTATRVRRHRRRTSV